MLSEYSLEGKSALITGGGRGIGKVIALVLAEAGADIAVASRTLDQVEQVANEIRSLGRNSVAVQLDVSDSAQAEQAVSQATAALGKIDILVNNAGISYGAVPLIPIERLPEEKISGDLKAGLTDDQWSRLLNINLSGAFYCCRAVAGQMLERRSGKIINVSSMTGILAEAYYTAYDSSKAALNMLTKCLALEWGRFNINVNGIGPGWFMTEMTRPGFIDQAVHEARVKGVPLQRLTDARDIGLLAVYLASPASDWMTGQVIYLDGGQSAIHA